MLLFEDCLLPMRRLWHTTRQVSALSRLRTYYSQLANKATLELK
jgi:hypothetical protein